jgi:hypothetical protein
MTVSANSFAYTRCPGPHTSIADPGHKQRYPSTPRRATASNSRSSTRTMASWERCRTTGRAYGRAAPAVFPPKGGRCVAWRPVDRVDHGQCAWRAQRCAVEQVFCVKKPIRASPQKPILVIMFVTDVAREAALRPRVSMQSHGDMQNVLVQARRVRHTGARWYGSSHVKGTEEGRCFQTDDTSQMRTRPGRSR